MRVLTIALAFSLIGCVDDLSSEPVDNGDEVTDGDDETVPDEPTVPGDPTCGSDADGTFLKGDGQCLPVVPPNR
jgi:hypothetical protein